MILKIAIVGICICIISGTLKSYNKSYVIFIEIVFLCVAVGFVLNDISQGLKNLRDIFSLSSYSNKLFSCLFKGALICIITRIASDIGKESGNIIVSDIIELTGRIMLIIISMPFIESVVETAMSFVI